MLKKSYPNQEHDIIKFLYKETTQEEREEMLPSLFENDNFREEFDDLLDTKQQLDEMPAEDWIATHTIPTPSNRCISRILDAAKLDKSKEA